MQAGQLRHRVTFQKMTLTPNTIGEKVKTWADYVTVWGSEEPARGSQYYAAKQLDSKVDGMMKIRYRDDIEPTMRMVRDGRILEIVSIINVKGRNRELQIPYTEALD